MKNSVVTENKNIPFKFILDSKLRRYKSDNLNIKGLKIAKSLINLEEWDLNIKNSKILNMKKEIENIKEDKRNFLLKNYFEKIVLKEDKVLKKNYNKVNNYSFNFEVFKNKNKDNHKNVYKIPHPINKNNKNFSLNNHNCLINNNFRTEPTVKEDKYNILPSIENESNHSIHYLEDYNNIINERRNYEFKIHLCISDLGKYLDEIKSNFKDLYNQETQILANNKKFIRRISASSALFGFTPKKKEKEKILKRKDKINILNYQLKDNISIFNCEGIFNNVAQTNIVNQKKQILSNSKIKIAEKEIEKTEKQLMKNVKSITNYYLDILKKSLDIRSEGMIWVVKRLLRLNYIPKINDFPEFIDERLYNYVITISKLKNELYNLIKEFQDIKKKLFDDKNFINLKNKIKNTFDNYNNENNKYFTKNNKHRYYSADNKYSINSNISDDSLTNKNISYLENIYDKYINLILFPKLPEDIQILLCFISKDINLKKKLSKKDVNEKSLNTKDIRNEKKIRSLSLKKENNLLIKNNKKNILQNKSELYSIKIKMKNKFIKLNEEEKWNKEINIKRKSIAESLMVKAFKNIEEKYLNYLNISFDTFNNLKKFAFLNLKINDINLNIKREIRDIQKYLETKKSNILYSHILKFIFGDKIR